jgi:hypothetical protein
LIGPTLSFEQQADALARNAEVRRQRLLRTLALIRVRREWMARQTGPVLRLAESIGVVVLGAVATTGVIVWARWYFRKRRGF